MFDIKSHSLNPPFECLWIFLTRVDLSSVAIPLSKLMSSGYEPRLRFKVLNNQKSEGAKPGEYGGWAITLIFFACSYESYLSYVDVHHHGGP